MPVVLQNSGGLPTYRTSEKYVSGWRYRIFLSNNEPAYVYVLASDLSNLVYRRFPVDNRTSAALFYKQNDIALPAEKGQNSLFELDENSGTTYALVLYSYNELQIDDIVANIRAASGDFAQKAKSALGDGLVRRGDMSLESKSIKFSSKSAASVVAILVEIDHRD